jgi:hypothetical protein
VLIQQRWWSWAVAEETATNPVVDRSGADCARNQPDDLWFLAGTFGVAVRRTCSVPAGSSRRVGFGSQCRTLHPRAQADLPGSVR